MLYPNHTTKQIVNREIEKKIQNLEEANEQNASAITTVGNAVNELGERTSTNEEDIADIKGSIESINSDIDDINDALEDKQDRLTIIDTVTEDAENPVKSSGIYDALEEKIDITRIKDHPEPDGTDVLSTGGAFDIVNDIGEALGEMREAIEEAGFLKVDDVPTEGSRNVVRSGGVYDAIKDSVEALDAETIGGNGKYIKSVSETDGVISAEAGTIQVTVNTSNEPVSSSAVKTALDKKLDTLCKTVPIALNTGSNQGYYRIYEVSGNQPEVLSSFVKAFHIYGVIGAYHNSLNPNTDTQAVIDINIDIINGRIVGFASKDISSLCDIYYTKTQENNNFDIRIYFKASSNEVMLHAYIESENGIGTIFTSPTKETTIPTAGTVKSLFTDFPNCVKQSETLSTPITIDGSSATTVEGALSLLNTSLVGIKSLYTHTIPAGKAVRIADVYNAECGVSFLAVRTFSEHLGEKIEISVINHSTSYRFKLNDTFLYGTENGEPYSFYVYSFNKEITTYDIPSTGTVEEFTDDGTKLYTNLIMNNNEVHLSGVTVNGNYTEGGIRRENINQDYYRYSTIVIRGTGLISFNHGKIKVKVAIEFTSSSNYPTTRIEWVDANLSAVGVYEPIYASLYYEYITEQTPRTNVVLYFNGANGADLLHVDYTEGNIDFAVTQNQSAVTTGTELKNGFTGVNEPINGVATPEDIAALDASSVGGTGKYIKEISETDGVISATEGTIDDTVTEESGNPVTSGAVASALKVPSDAVVHYSFDEIPDYPDGTADVRLLDNNTYQIQSSIYKFTSNEGGATFSNDNGKLLIQISSNNIYKGAYIIKTLISDKIIKFKINVTSISGRMIFHFGGTVLLSVEKTGVYELVTIGSSSTSLYCAGVANTQTDCIFTVEEIYIGDGSYVTPIIDNANGKNNAINSGAIAVQGMSGKGGYFLNRKYASLGTQFNLTPNFTLCAWVKPDNNTSALMGDIFRKTSQFVLRNGSSSDNFFMCFLYDDSGTAILNKERISDLLPANEWSFITFIRNNLKAYVYINGNQEKEFTLPNTTLNISNYDFRIMGDTNTRPQSMDDFLIFDRALSEEEVKALYLNKANTPKFYDIADYNIENIDSLVSEKQNKTLTSPAVIDGNSNSTVENSIGAIANAISKRSKTITFTVDSTYEYFDIPLNVKNDNLNHTRIFEILGFSCKYCVLIDLNPNKSPTIRGKGIAMIADTTPVDGVVWYADSNNYLHLIIKTKPSLSGSDISVVDVQNLIDENGIVYNSVSTQYTNGTAITFKQVAFSS